MKRNKTAIKRMSNGNYITNAKIEEIVRREAEVQSDQIYMQAYKRAAQDIIPQMHIYTLKALAVAFGFGEKRMKQFLETYEDLNLFCDTGCMGKKISTDDIAKELRDKYHIDTEKLKECNIKIEEV